MLQFRAEVSTITVLVSQKGEKMKEYAPKIRTAFEDSFHLTDREVSRHYGYWNRYLEGCENPDEAILSLRNREAISSDSFVALGPAVLLVPSVEMLPFPVPAGFTPFVDRPMHNFNGIFISNMPPKLLDFAHRVLVIGHEAVEKEGMLDEMYRERYELLFSEALRFLPETTTQGKKLSERRERNRVLLTTA